MIELLTPVGRLVYGNLYKPNVKKDNNGAPKLGNDGQPMVSFDYGLAIPKGGEQHWAQTEWGRLIWEEGHRAFPRGETQRPDFAWKIHDGDSTVPNRANKRYCDKEGYPGHWVLNFSTGWPSKYVNHDGSRVLLDNELIKPGYYVQIAGTVSGNDSTQSPGLYLNHQVMSLQSVFAEIESGTIDATTVGFGQAAMPNGLQRTTVPPPGMTQGNVPPLPPQAPPVVAPPPVYPSHGAQGASYVVNPVGNPPPPPPGTPVQPVPNYGMPPQGNYPPRV